MMTKNNRHGFDVSWPVGVGQECVGAPNGRAVYVSVTGLRFLSSHRYELEETVELVLWPESSPCVFCLVRVVRERHSTHEYHVYDAVYEYFFGQDRRILGDTLLEMRLRAVPPPALLMRWPSL